MIKKIWTCKKIVAIISLSMLVIIFANSVKLAVVAGSLDVALFLFVFLIFFGYLLFISAYPKKFDCMKIVKKYLSLKELKSYIEKEEFHKFVMENISDPFRFHYSKNWFFVNDTYIPRKIVLDIVAMRKSLFSPITIIGIVTQNGEAVCLAQVKNEEEEQVTSELKKAFPEFKNDVQILKEAQYKKFYQENKKKFEKEITNKKEFIAYCEI